jgi:ribulose-bisphosphate carboxylase small chain
MRITQGAFSFLPDLTVDEIRAQLEYCLDNGWAVSVEYTDDPHPRNTYWEMWGQPMFDLHDAAGIMGELAECRAAHGHEYIRVTAFDSTHGVESVALSFIVNRPAEEPGFRLDRTEAAGRTQRYAIRSYAVDHNPSGERYGA